MRAIDADLLEPDADYDDGEYWAVSMAQIQGAPTIEERKTGKWIKSNNSCTIRCNQCGQEMTSLCDIQLPNYCLNCGSQMMRGEEE